MNWPSAGGRQTNLSQPEDHVLYSKFAHKGLMALRLTCFQWLEIEISMCWIFSLIFTLNIMAYYFYTFHLKKTFVIVLYISPRNDQSIHVMQVFFTFPDNLVFEDIDIDHFNGQLYLIDSLKNRILQTDLTATRNKTIINTNIDSPRGLALDLTRRYSNNFLFLSPITL